MPIRDGQEFSVILSEAKDLAERPPSLLNREVRSAQDDRTYCGSIFAILT